MYFNNWAYTERSGYKVTSTFNIQTLKVPFHSSNLNYLPSVNITDRLNIINFKQPLIWIFFDRPKTLFKISKETSLESLRETSSELSLECKIILCARVD